MTDRTSNEYAGATRYKLTTGHSDDAGLGGEGWIVRMSDHFPSFDTAQKWVKAEDYEALRLRFVKACARVTELESQVETKAPLTPNACDCGVYHPTWCSSRKTNGEPV
jgi:hypothetical protein